MNSQDITVTEGRTKSAVDTFVSTKIMPRVSDEIKKTVEDIKIHTGVITKFYPYLDKAEVKLDKSNKKVLCKILHRYGGDMIDFYTPSSAENIFCDDLKEPCVIPRAVQHVFLIDVPDMDFSLILGYFTNEDELVGFNPAAPGDVKLMSLRETNLYWIKFGTTGFEYRLPSTPTMNVGVLDDEMEEFDYADSSQVYTKEEVYNKEEVYTKEEVDELIKKAIAEALGEDDMDDTTP